MKVDLLVLVFALSISICFLVSFCSVFWMLLLVMLNCWFCRLIMIGLGLCGVGKMLSVLSGLVGFVSSLLCVILLMVLRSMYAIAVV